MPCWKRLEQRHIYLVIARAINVVLLAAKEGNRCSLVDYRRLIQDWNAIRIGRANRMRVIRDHLAGQWIAEGARVVVVQLCADRTRARGEAWVARVRRTSTAERVFDGEGTSAAIGRYAVVGRDSEGDTGLRRPGQARRPAADRLIGQA